MFHVRRLNIKDGALSGDLAILSVDHGTAASVAATGQGYAFVLERPDLRKSNFKKRRYIYGAGQEFVFTTPSGAVIARATHRLRQNSDNPELPLSFGIAGLDSGGAIVVWGRWKGRDKRTWAAALAADRKLLWKRKLSKVSPGLGPSVTGFNAGYHGIAGTGNHALVSGATWYGTNDLSWRHGVWIMRLDP
ncbi:MAG: hypothetical protein HQL37_16225 [Alphaproteobacteria bacterium]|nr:hypothetical protein [Alphaproteobacteria bacterium]